MPSVPRMRRQRERGRSDRAFVVIDGKRIKLGIWGSEEAESRYRELITGSSTPKPKSDQPSEAEPSTCPTVIEVMAPFMSHVVKAYPENDAEVWHFRAALKILKAQFGELQAEQFGPRRLRKVREAMIEKGWSRRYVNGQVSRIKRMFRWAVAEERLGPAVYQALCSVEGLREGRTEAHEPPPVSSVADEVVDATLPFLNATVADMVAVQRLCGCRPGELCMMATENIDRTGEVWLYTPPRHKTQHHGKRRIIALGPKSQSILKRYLFHVDDFFPYTTASYRQAIRRACDRAFPPGENLSEVEAAAWRKQHRWKPNQLRHTAATKVRAEHGIEGAQHVLGHARANVTEVYAEKNLEQAKAIALRMG